MSDNFQWTDELVKEFIADIFCYPPNQGNPKDFTAKGTTSYQLMEQFKQSKSQPLFTTNDGVDIFKRDNYWLVYSDTFQIDNGIANGSGYILSSGVKVINFSTEQAAKEYVLMNKPCLSVNDVICKYGFINEDLTYFTKAIEKLAEQKINQ